MKYHVSTLALMMAISLSAAAHAEETKSVVNAQGSATLERMPEIVRLKIDIPASAPDIREALVKLKAKQESAVKKLKDMGAAEAAISFEGPRMGVDQAEAMRKRMSMMHGRSNPMEDEEEKKPANVNVTIELQAEWPVKAEDSETLLVFAHELQEKIKAADLAGLKDEQLSEEEEEKLAEARSQFGGYDPSEQAAPGEPLIMYVCTITQQDNDKLLAEAFAKAKAEATRLATVAGAQLDSLSSIGSSFMDRGDHYAMRSMYSNPMMYQIMQRMQTYMTPERMEKEAIGAEPKKIVHRMSVMVTYRLK